MNRPHYITPPIEESLPLFGAARRSDPQTSHAAAATAPVGEHQAAILEALSLGPAGASLIGERTGLDPHQIRRRTSELAEQGKIVTTGRIVRSSSGRGEREWQITAASR